MYFIQDAFHLYMYKRCYIVNATDPKATVLDNCPYNRLQCMPIKGEKKKGLCGLHVHWNTLYCIVQNNFLIAQS